MTDFHDCEPVEVYDYMGCSESVIGWGCSVCCYDDEYPREDCPHGADHRGVAEHDACPTRAAVESTDALGALARVREKAWAEGYDARRSEDSQSPGVANPYRIEAEAGDPLDESS